MCASARSRSACKLINHIFPKGNFAEAWTNLTTGGKFRVSVNQCFSDYQSIRKGDPQGGPSAQTKFNIYMHVFISLLQAPCMQNLSLKIRNQILPPITYADDLIKSMQLKTINDVVLVKKLLQRLKSTIGLEVNFKKTNILTNGEFPPQPK